MGLEGPQGGGRQNEPPPTSSNTKGYPRTESRTDERRPTGREGGPCTGNTPRLAVSVGCPGSPAQTTGRGLLWSTVEVLRDEGPVGEDTTR